MTELEAFQQVSERWKRMGIKPMDAPLVFSGDVDNAMGCECIRLRFSNDSPHHVTCPCYAPNLNQKINAEIKEQFRNGTLSCSEYDA